MIRNPSSLVLVAACTAVSHAEVRINEVDLANNKVELINTGPSAVDMTGWQWCNRATGSPFYGAVTSFSTVDTALSSSGAAITNFLVGQTLVLNITDPDFLPDASGEFSVYTSGSFGSSTAIEDYMSWNNAGVRDSVAAGHSPALWVTNATINTAGIQAGDTLQAVAGTGGTGPTEWFIGPSTLGAANVAPDTTPPNVVSITPATTSPSDQVVQFTVVFSEEVENFGVGDFTTESLTDITLAQADNVATADNITFTFDMNVTVADGSPSGTLTAQVAPAGITDLAGNSLAGAGPISSLVTFPASEYQLWASAEGLTPGPDFGPGGDPDLDGSTNAEEFLRNNDPSMGNDPLKYVVHVAESGGEEYAVFTIAAPDSLAYAAELNPTSIPGLLAGSVPFGGFGYIDQVLASRTLPVDTSDSPVLVEDPSVIEPGGLPPLAAGWSYRHLRFSTPLGSEPRGFFQSEVIEAE